ncbi:EAL and HDOD domain-containing protein [Granulosicoccus sp. 3-233]|uniref:EAL and HDOD domain-containing protein n=1 Tax=Granulosicoccus sp. 3-233 TaxID=3417969 RepID=UPI003D324F6B
MTSFHIARQPILDVAGNTFGYELLFRSSERNAYDPTVDGNTATSMVLFNAVAEIGLDKLVGNSLAFINLTNLFFEQPDMLDLMPVGRCVLEVLETVDVNDEVVAGVQALRNKGHLIALDDFVDPERFERLLSLTDIVKYDITQHTMESLAEQCKTDHAAGRLCLAERVETHEEFEQLKAGGFDYFQGYYFARPLIVSGSRMPENRVALMQLIAEINNPDSTIDDLAEIVGRDVSLAVRTIKYVNSPLNGLSTNVESIRQAAVLLGRSLISNWVTLLVMSRVDDQPSELIKLALVRARFCQLIAQEEQVDDARYFTLGLLSLLDVFMGSTMEEALAEVTINEELRTELLTREGNGGRMLAWVECLEKGQSEQLDEEILDMAGRHYQSATVWAEEIAGQLL